MKQISLVLCRPEGSINIGASCRAIKTMGFSNLKLVKPAPINTDEVKQWSLTAFNIFEQAEYFDNLQQALAGSILAVGTCRRHGKHRKNHYLLPGELAALCSDYTEGEIAIVFGNERDGLSDDELALCHRLVTIPSSESYPSLNLSHAVQLICYELFKTKNITPKRFNLINHEKVAALSEHAITNLDKLAFFAISGATGKKEAAMFWHDILGRAGLTSREEHYLYNFFDKIANINTEHYK
ncbi:MAG: RNA methyltransferase [Spirochaetaceae bacterium]|nr:RNA methyltransferase [Spirochaetaceae bacterium]